MASSTDIVAAMKSLDLGPIQDPKELKTSSPATEATSAKKTKGGPYKPKSSRPKPPKSQPEKLAVFPVNATPAPEPKLVDTADPEEAYQFQARAERGAVPTSPRRPRRSPRNRRTSQTNSNPNPPVSKPAPSTPQPASKNTTLPSKAEAASPPQEVTRPLYRYVVQASGNGEQIIGIYTDLEKANERAAEYVKRWDVEKSQIQDIKTGFGKSGLATRRCWGNGMSEIKVSRGWVKVLPKEFVVEKRGEEGGLVDAKAFLALDRNEGLFVIGVYAGKEEAWEACRKYWAQLAYWDEVQHREQWFDKQGMLHARGKIGGREHHWFVAEYVLDEKVE